MGEGTRSKLPRRQLGWTPARTGLLSIKDVSPMNGICYSALSQSQSWIAVRPSQHACHAHHVHAVLFPIICCLASLRPNPVIRTSMQIHMPIPDTVLQQPSVVPSAPRWSLVRQQVLAEKLHEPET